MAPEIKIVTLSERVCGERPCAARDRAQEIGRRNHVRLRLSGSPLRQRGPNANSA